MVSRLLSRHIRNRRPNDPSPTAAAPVVDIAVKLLENPVPPVPTDRPSEPDVAVVASSNSGATLLNKPTNLIAPASFSPGALSAATRFAVSPCIASSACVAMEAMSGEVGYRRARRRMCAWMSKAVVWRVFWDAEVMMEVVVVDGKEGSVVVRGVSGGRVEPLVVVVEEVDEAAADAAMVLASREGSSRISDTRSTLSLRRIIRLLRSRRVFSAPPLVPVAAVPTPRPYFAAKFCAALSRPGIACPSSPELAESAGNVPFRSSKLSTAVSTARKLRVVRACRESSMLREA